MGSASIKTAGFTLIELSIVLVIIGLIVGGVLVGQDLIRAASVRAQITQIEKLNTAVNTFYGKYQALPGDLNQTTATTFGFAARGSGEGEGDGNGIIEGNNAGGGAYGWTLGNGETGMFFVDLTSANGQNLNLIDGGFSTATPSNTSNYYISSTQMSLYFPAAKIGNSSVYVYSNNGVNYYGVASYTSYGIYAGGCANFGPAFSVKQAYEIDRKMDDGLPQSGNVQDVWASGCAVYNIGDSTSPSSSTCADQGGNASSPYNYSVAVNNGASVNCALSFKFQ